MTHSIFFKPGQFVHIEYLDTTCERQRGKVQRTWQQLTEPKNVCTSECQLRGRPLSCTITWSFCFQFGHAHSAMTSYYFFLDFPFWLIAPLDYSHRSLLKTSLSGSLEKDEGQTSTANKWREKLLFVHVDHGQWLPVKMLSLKVCQKTQCEIGFSSNFV